MGHLGGGNLRQSEKCRHYCIRVQPADWPYHSDTPAKGYLEPQSGDKPKSWYFTSVLRGIAVGHMLSAQRPIVMRYSTPEILTDRSTIVCALGRLYGVITLDYHSDVVYGVSPLMMWGTGETTCLLLVLCIPTFPKAFSHGAGITTSIGRSLATWARVSARSVHPASKGQRNPSWRSKTAPDTYQMMGDSQMQLAEWELAQIVPDATLGNAERGILRTTELRTTQGEALPALPQDRLSRQHPWITEHR